MLSLIKCKYVEEKDCKDLFRKDASGQDVVARGWLYEKYKPYTKFAKEVILT